MQFPGFDPVLLQLGPLSIRRYALAYVAGILIGWRYALILVNDPGLWGPRTPVVVPLVATGALLLARSARPQNP